MKTYPLTSFWKYYSLISGSLLVWFILGAIVYPGNHFDFLFILSMLGMTEITYAFYSAPPSHIVVSANGIGWNGPGFTLSTQWNHITRVSHRVYGFSVQEGLATNKL